MISEYILFYWQFIFIYMYIHLKTIVVVTQVTTTISSNFDTKSMMNCLRHTSEINFCPAITVIKFKLCLIMHAAVCGQSLDYIRGAVTPLAMLPGRNMFRAAANGLYDVPRTRTMFGQRAFSVAGSWQWNDLPSDIWEITDRAAFKRALKSIFFGLA